MDHCEATGFRIRIVAKKVEKMHAANNFCNKIQALLNSRDEFELEFSGSSEPEL